MSDDWKVTLIDTGENTMTGGRLKRVAPFLSDEPFCFTYGDGISNVDISSLIDFHKEHGKLATVTAVQPPVRFGALDLDENNMTVKGFREKNKIDGSWINGGFFVLNPSVVDLIDNDQTVWEKDPLEKLAALGELSAFKHYDFWQPMDTLREKNLLQDLWATGNAPWQVWQ